MSSQSSGPSTAAVSVAATPRRSSALATSSTANKAPITPASRTSDAAAAAKKAAKEKELAQKNSIPSLSFPPISADPTSHLSHFRDDTSAYSAAAKSCLHLTQYAAVCSNASMEETSTVASSALFHDSSFADTISTALSSIIECTQSHKDRRCRILSCQTLAIVARSSYARIRHSPLLYSMRDMTVNRLEDEVGMDVPSALITVALSDPDDGVSVAAVEALGILTLSSSPTTGTVVEDELLREVHAIAFCRPSPYAPSLRAVADEDPSIGQMELTSRVFENALAPRLVQLIDRVCMYSSKRFVSMAVPCVTACLVHQVKTTPAALFGMDRQTFAKRWVDVDSVGLTTAFVEAILLPAVQFATDGTLAGGAALGLLRLAHVCPSQAWAEEACLWAARVLKDEISVGNMVLESKLSALATLVVALRGVSVASNERRDTIQWIAGVVATLPSTGVAPLGIASAPGVLVEGTLTRQSSESSSIAYFRRPTRIALWTEIALLLFVDGVDSGVEDVRADALSAFFERPTVSKLLVDVKIRQSSVLSLFDELLLTFTTAAADCGRRFRTMADGTLLVMDPEARQVVEWVKLAEIVLTTFRSCTGMGAPMPFQEEELTMLAAGQASYLRLLQEYLYMVGLINPETSVALKITSNSCPPNLLWDQMAESASLLSKFDSVDIPDAEAAATKLVDDLIARETKQGASSHHLRMFLLTLAADSWIQGRTIPVRKQFEATATSSATPSIREQSARSILLALSPKRLLTKIYETNAMPPEADGRRKRDPIKKIAQETVKAAVACIEGIGLMACDWRRRFGPSQETKLIVSVAVGLLQGKVDESHIDDNIRSIMGPICEAAVGRIQAFYESSGGGGADQSFPVSDLVNQHIKPKIKPLVSPAKATVAPKEKIAQTHMMQLCRQIVSARVEQSVLSAPPADSLLLSARPHNGLRLSVPPMPESRDGRVMGNVGDVLSAWDKEVVLSSAASDATSVVAACTPRRYFRYDGEEEFRIAILVRAFNTTPIVFTDGMRLDLGTSYEMPHPDDMRDPFSLDIIQSLGGDTSEHLTDSPLVSSSAEYRHEIKAGDFITWEISVDQLASISSCSLVPSVVYRNVKVEAPDAGAKWVGDKSNQSGDASTATPGSKSGEDDFQVTSRDTGKGAFKGDDSDVELVTLRGEPLTMSPMSGLQPCPLVFFRDAWGDSITFRLFWFQMSYQLPPLRIASSSESKSASPVDKKVAEMASLQFEGEAIPSGVATRLWAFSAIRGGRVFCLLADNETGKTPGQTLYFRSDDRMLLFSLLGTKAARECVVATLCPGMTISA